MDFVREAEYAEDGAFREAACWRLAMIARYKDQRDQLGTEVVGFECL